MEELGISGLEELHRKTGIDRGSLSRYFRQERNPGLDVIAPLCEALEVSPETLLVALGAVMIREAPSLLNVRGKLSSDQSLCKWASSSLLRSLLATSRTSSKSWFRPIVTRMSPSTLVRAGITQSSFTTSSILNLAPFIFGISPSTSDKESRKSTTSEISLAQVLLISNAVSITPLDEI
jgi:transcriptional regulator with XRE-family HTH domain